MSLIANIFKAKESVPIPYVLSLPSGGLSAEGRTEDYLKAYGEIGWLFACVSRISASVGETSWMLHRRVKDGLEKLDAHPLLHLLSDANPYMTGQELMEYTQMWLDLAGDAFWVLNRTARGLPVEIWPVPPNRMRVIASREQFISGYIYTWGANEVPFEPEEVVHFKYPNPTSLYRGMGPVQALAVDLDSEVYAAKYNRNFFLNSGRPDGLLQAEQGLTTEQFKQLMERWRAGHQGVDRAHRIAVLDGGMKYQQISLSQRDMDFGALRKANRDLILAAYGVPYSILGGAEDINRANAESSEYTFARWTILPRLKRIAYKLNETLVPMFGADMVLSAKDPTPENREQARGDAESGIKAGYMLVDEARVLMGLDPLPDGRGAVLVQPLTSVQIPINGGKQAKSFLDGSSPHRHLLRGKALTEEQKDLLGELFLKRLDPRETKFKDLMRQHFQAQEEAIIAALRKGGKTAHKDLADVYDDEFWARWTANLGKDGRAPVIAVLVGAAEDAIIDYGLNITFDLTNPRVQRWIGTRMEKFSTSVTETTREVITAQLREAEAAGEGIPDMVKRIRGYYDENADRRAEITARTEVVSASNTGAVESYRQANLNDWEWWVQFDGRQCTICEPFHKTTYPVSQNFDAPHPQCLLGDTCVTPVGRIAAATKRWYEGNVIFFRTAGGYEITVTPNHPVLSNGRWVPAQNLQPGDQVLSSAHPQRVTSLIYPDYQNMPARIEDVFRSLRTAGQMASSSVPSTRKDFHGDGAYGQVNIVRPTRMLRYNTESHLAQQVGQLHFIRRHPCSMVRADCPLRKALSRTPGPLGSEMSRLDLMRSLSWRHASPLQDFGLRLTSSADTPLFQNLTDTRTADSVELSHGILRYAGLIESDCIVRIERRWFSGHVYNLQTESGWYIGNNIITHNCRCTVLPVVG